METTEVDAARRLLVVCQYAAATGTTLRIEQVWEIRGAYETQGWDPRSVLYAVMEDATEVAVLILPGTDEVLAEYACRTLGCLLDRPATYAGPFGGVRACYVPAGARCVLLADDTPLRR
jgi:hypothetical protein